MEEECEYGLPSGTFTARHLEVVAVAGLLWIYFVVCFLVSGGICFFFRFLYFERTRPAASMRAPLASFTSLPVPGCVQGAIIRAKRVSNRYIPKKSLHGVRVFD